MSSAPAKNGEGGRRLSFAELALWLPFNLVFAIAPYPWIAAWTAGLQGPRSTWLPFASQFLKAAQPISRACGCPGAFAWDFALFMAFGALHSFMASATGKALVRSTVPPQVQPTIFAAVSNAAVICVAAAWASCPGAVWEAKSGALRVALLSGKILAIVADLSFNFHFPACDCERQFHTSLCGFDSLELFGTSALFQTAEEAAAAADSAPARDGHEPTLITTGLFRFVRHPMYSLLLLQIVLEPSMTMDRLYFFIAALAYISWGHRLEDRKLERKFGPAYSAYRARVAAFIPFLF